MPFTNCLCSFLHFILDKRVILSPLVSHPLNIQYTDAAYTVGVVETRLGHS